MYFAGLIRTSTTMKGYICIEIPVKPYSRAYVKHLVGDTLTIRRDGHSIEIKLLDLLQHPENKNNNHHYNLGDYKARLKAMISSRDFKERGNALNESNLRIFNAYIERKCKERFYELMDDAVQIFPMFEKNLPAIRKRMGIDVEDWADDSMKKDYYRYRKKNGMPLLYQKIKESNGGTKKENRLW